MKEAGFGRGEDYIKNKKVRGDVFVWLSDLAYDDGKPISKEKLEKHTFLS